MLTFLYLCWSVLVVYSFGSIAVSLGKLSIWVLCLLWGISSPTWPYVSQLMWLHYCIGCVTVMSFVALTPIGQYVWLRSYASRATHLEQERLSSLIDANITKSSINYWLIDDPSPASIVLGKNTIVLARYWLDESDDNLRLVLLHNYSKLQCHYGRHHALALGAHSTVMLVIMGLKVATKLVDYLSYFWILKIFKPIGYFFLLVTTVLHKVWASYQQFTHLYSSNKADAQLVKLGYGNALMAYLTEHSSLTMAYQQLISTNFFVQTAQRIAKLSKALAP